MRKMVVGSMVAAALLLGGQARAQAQAHLDGELVAKIKKACAKELSTFCKGVPQGEGRILACFYAFQDKLSDPCLFQLYDASAQLEQAATAVKFAANQCQDDMNKFCANVKPGQGRALACLNKHDKDVSQQCKDALVQTGLRKPKK